MTRNQVVLAWLLADGVEPIVGVTRSEPLAEAMAARQITLDPDHRARLDDPALN